MSNIVQSFYSNLIKLPGRFHSRIISYHRKTKYFLIYFCSGDNKSFRLSNLLSESTVPDIDHVWEFNLSIQTKILYVFPFESQNAFVMITKAQGIFSLFFVDIFDKVVISVAISSVRTIEAADLDQNRKELIVCTSGGSLISFSLRVVAPRGQKSFQCIFRKKVKIGFENPAKIKDLKTQDLAGLTLILSTEGIHCYDTGTLENVWTISSAIFASSPNSLVVDKFGCDFLVHCFDKTSKIDSIEYWSPPRSIVSCDHGQFSRASIPIHDSVLHAYIETLDDVNHTSVVIILMKSLSLQMWHPNNTNRDALILDCSLPLTMGHSGSASLSSKAPSDFGAIFSERVHGYGLINFFSGFGGAKSVVISRENHLFIANLITMNNEDSNNLGILSDFSLMQAHRGKEMVESSDPNTLSQFQNIFHPRPPSEPSAQILTAENVDKLEMELMKSMRNVSTPAPPVIDISIPSSYEYFGEQNAVNFQPSIDDSVLTMLQANLEAMDDSKPTTAEDSRPIIVKSMRTPVLSPLVSPQQSRPPSRRIPSIVDNNSVAGSNNMNGSNVASEMLDGRPYLSVGAAPSNPTVIAFFPLHYLQTYEPESDGFLRILEHPSALLRTQGNYTLQLSLITRRVLSPIDQPLADYRDVKVNIKYAAVAARQGLMATVTDLKELLVYDIRKAASQPSDPPLRVEFGVRQNASPSTLVMCDIVTKCPRESIVATSNSAKSAPPKSKVRQFDELSGNYSLCLLGDSEGFVHFAVVSKNVIFTSGKFQAHSGTSVQAIISTGNASRPLWRIAARPQHRGAKSGNSSNGVMSYVAQSIAGSAIITISVSGEVKLWQPIFIPLNNSSCRAENMLNVTTVEWKVVGMFSATRSRRLSDLTTEGYLTDSFNANNAVKTVWASSLDPTCTSLLLGGSDGSLEQWGLPGLLASPPALVTARDPIWLDIRHQGALCSVRVWTHMSGCDIGDVEVDPDGDVSRQLSQYALLLRGGNNTNQQQQQQQQGLYVGYSREHLRRLAERSGLVSSGSDQAVVLWRFMVAPRGSGNNSEPALCLRPIACRRFVLSGPIADGLSYSISGLERAPQDMIWKIVVVLRGALVEVASGSRDLLFVSDEYLDNENSALDTESKSTNAEHAVVDNGDLDSISSSVLNQPSPIPIQPGNISNIAIQPSLLQDSFMQDGVMTLPVIGKVLRPLRVVEALTSNLGKGTISWDMLDKWSSNVAIPNRPFEPKKHSNSKKYSDMNIPKIVVTETNIQIDVAVAADVLDALVTTKDGKQKVDYQGIRLAVDSSAVVQTLQDLKNDPHARHVVNKDTVEDLSILTFGNDLDDEERIFTGINNSARRIEGSSGSPPPFGYSDPLMIHNARSPSRGGLFGQPQSTSVPSLEEVMPSVPHTPISPYGKHSNHHATDDNHSKEPRTDLSLTDSLTAEDLQEIADEINKVEPAPSMPFKTTKAMQLRQKTALDNKGKQDRLMKTNEKKICYTSKTTLEKSASDTTVGKQSTVGTALFAQPKSSYEDNLKNANKKPPAPVERIDKMEKLKRSQSEHMKMLQDSVLEARVISLPNIESLLNESMSLDEMKSEVELMSGQIVVEDEVKSHAVTTSAATPLAPSKPMTPAKATTPTPSHVKPTTPVKPVTPMDDNINDSLATGMDSESVRKDAAVDISPLLPVHGTTGKSGTPSADVTANVAAGSTSLPKGKIVVAKQRVTVVKPRPSSNNTQQQDAPIAKSTTSKVFSLDGEVDTNAAAKVPATYFDKAAKPIVMRKAPPKVNRIVSKRHAGKGGLDDLDSDGLLSLITSSILSTLSREQKLELRAILHTLNDDDLDVFESLGEAHRSEVVLSLIKTIDQTLQKIQETTENVTINEKEKVDAARSSRVNMKELARKIINFARVKRALMLEDENAPRPPMVEEIRQTVAAPDSSTFSCLVSTAGVLMAVVFPNNATIPDQNVLETGGTLAELSPMCPGLIAMQTLVIPESFNFAEPAVIEVTGLRPSREYKAFFYLKNTSTHPKATKMAIESFEVTETLFKTAMERLDVEWSRMSESHQEIEIRAAFRSSLVINGTKAWKPNFGILTDEELSIRFSDNTQGRVAMKKYKEFVHFWSGDEGGSGGNTSSAVSVASGVSGGSLGNANSNISLRGHFLYQEVLYHLREASNSPLVAEALANDICNQEDIDRLSLFAKMAPPDQKSPWGTPLDCDAFRRIRSFLKAGDVIEDQWQSLLDKVNEDNHKEWQRKVDEAAAAEAAAQEEGTDNQQPKPEVPASPVVVEGKQGLVQVLLQRRADFLTRRVSQVDECRDALKTLFDGLKRCEKQGLLPGDLTLKRERLKDDDVAAIMCALKLHSVATSKSLLGPPGTAGGTGAGNNVSSSASVGSTSSVGSAGGKAANQIVSQLSAVSANINTSLSSLIDILLSLDPNTLRPDPPPMLRSPCLPGTTNRRPIRPWASCSPGERLLEVLLALCLDPICELAIEDGIQLPDVEDYILDKKNQILYYNPASGSSGAPGANNTTSNTATTNGNSMYFANLERDLNFGPSGINPARAKRWQDFVSWFVGDEIKVAKIPSVPRTMLCELWEMKVVDRDIFVKDCMRKLGLAVPPDLPDEVPPEELKVEEITDEIQTKVEENSKSNSKTVNKKSLNDDSSKQSAIDVDQDNDDDISESSNVISSKAKIDLDDDNIDNKSMNSETNKETSAETSDNPDVPTKRVRYSYSTPTTTHRSELLDYYEDSLSTHAGTFLRYELLRRAVNIFMRSRRFSSLRALYPRSGYRLSQQFSFPRFATLIVPKIDFPATRIQLFPSRSIESYTRAEILSWYSEKELDGEDDQMRRAERFGQKRRAYLEWLSHEKERVKLSRDMMIEEDRASTTQREYWRRVETEMTFHTLKLVDPTMSRLESKKNLIAQGPKGQRQTTSRGRDGGAQPMQVQVFAHSVDVDMHHQQGVDQTIEHQDTGIDTDGVIPVATHTVDNEEQVLQVEEEEENDDDMAVINLLKTSTSVPIEERLEYFQHLKVDPFVDGGVKPSQVFSSDLPGSMELLREYAMGPSIDSRYSDGNGIQNDDDYEELLLQQKKEARVAQEKETKLQNRLKEERKRREREEASRLRRLEQDRRLQEGVERRRLIRENFEEIKKARLLKAIEEGKQRDEQAKLEALKFIQAEEEKRREHDLYRLKVRESQENDAMAAEDVFMHDLLLRVDEVALMEHEDIQSVLRERYDRLFEEYCRQRSQELKEIYEPFTPFVFQTERVTYPKLHEILDVADAQAEKEYLEELEEKHQKSNENDQQNTNTSTFARMKRLIAAPAPTIAFNQVDNQQVVDNILNNTYVQDYFRLSTKKFDGESNKKNKKSTKTIRLKPIANSADATQVAERIQQMIELERLNLESIQNQLAIASLTSFDDTKKAYKKNIAYYANRDKSQHVADIANGGVNDNTTIGVIAPESKDTKDESSLLHRTTKPPGPPLRPLSSGPPVEPLTRALANLASDTVEQLRQNKRLVQRYNASSAVLSDGYYLETVQNEDEKKRFLESVPTVLRFNREIRHEQKSLLEEHNLVAPQNPNEHGSNLAERRARNMGDIRKATKQRMKRFSESLNALPSGQLQGAATSGNGGKLAATVTSASNGVRLGLLGQTVTIGDHRPVLDRASKIGVKGSKTASVSFEDVPMISIPAPGEPSIDTQDSEFTGMVINAMDPSELPINNGNSNSNRVNNNNNDDMSYASDKTLGNVNFSVNISANSRATGGISEYELENFQSANFDNDDDDLLGNDLRLDSTVFDTGFEDSNIQLVDLNDYEIEGNQAALY